MARKGSAVGRKVEKGEGSRGQQESGRAKPKSEGGKINREETIGSRCSVSVFRGVMEGLEDKITPQQREAIRGTPFYHIGKVGMGNTSLKQLKAVVECYNPIKESFDIGDGVSIPFTEWEFSVVLGLQSIGQYVHPKCKSKSKIVEKYFDGHTARVVRSRIVEVLGQLAGTESVGDFARMYVLLVFNTVLFPDSNAHIPIFVISYVDKIGLIGEYAWGKSVYTFLVSSMRRHLRERTKNVDGCTVGLMGWFYERVPALASPRWQPKVPRFNRWIEVHADLRACRARLRAVTTNEVFPFILLPSEVKYVRVKRSQPKSTPLVRKNKASQPPEPDHITGTEESDFEDNPTTSETEEEKVDGRQHKEVGKSSRAGKMAKEDESVDGTEIDSNEEVSEEVEEAVEEDEDEDEDDDEDEEDKEDEDEDDDEERVDVGSTPKRASGRKGKLYSGDGGLSLEDILLAEDIVRLGLDPSLKNYPLTPNPLFAVTSEQRTKGREDRAAPSSIAVTSEQRTKGREDRAAPSSIARTVRGRKRNVKAKDPGFITPVSTPKRVRKRKQSPAKMAAKEAEQDVQAAHEAAANEAEQAARAAAAEAEQAAEAVPNEETGEEKVEVDAINVDDDVMDETTPEPAAKVLKYLGRRDYVGRDTLGEDDRIMIDLIVDQCDAKAPIVRDGLISMDAESLFELIFNEAISNDVISFYLSHLVSKEFTDAHGLKGNMLYVSAYTTTTILEAVDKSNATDDHCKKVYANMWEPSKQELRNLLQQVNDDVRCIVLPVCNKLRFHWFLVTFCFAKKDVILNNSMAYAPHKSAAGRVIKFMSWLLWEEAGYAFVRDPVMRNNRRTQPAGSMDCGVHVLWWAEAYLRDIPEFWEKEMTEDMKSYRIQIALRLLRDSRRITPAVSPMGSPPLPSSPHANVPALPPVETQPAAEPTQTHSDDSPLPVAAVPIDAQPVQVVPPGVKLDFED